MKRIPRPLWWIFAGNVLLRLPGVLWQDLPPYSFCDEDIFISEAVRMTFQHRWIIPDEFRAGGINVYLPLILLRVADGLGILGLNFKLAFQLARIPGVLLLASATIFPLFAAVRRIRDARTAYWAVAIFTISPMVLGLSRIAYPDHYLFFFAAVALYLAVRQKESGLQSLRLTAWTAVNLGLAVSTKYFGVFLAIPFFIMFFWLLKREYVGVPALMRAALRHASVFLACFALVVVILNLGAIIHRDKFLLAHAYNMQNYGTNNPLPFGVALDRAISFYTVILFLTCFGVGGALLIAGGTVILALRRDLLFLMFLTIYPVFLVLFMGRYGLYINRNMSSAIPFVIPLMAVALEYLNARFAHTKWKVVAWILPMLFFAEPVLKSAYSFKEDFGEDTRVATSNWVGAHIPPGTVIAYTPGCHYRAPVPVETYTLERADPGGKHEYLIADLWWTNVLRPPHLPRPGILSTLDYRDLHFTHFNGTGPPLSPVDESLLERYEIVAEFHGPGPDVVIYKKRHKSAKP